MWGSKVKGTNTKNRNTDENKNENTNTNTDDIELQTPKEEKTIWFVTYGSKVKGANPKK